jgi:hypothetical protein
MADYRLAWRRCKFWRNLGILALLGFFPVMALAGFITRQFDIPAFSIAVFIAWIVFMMSTGAEFAWFRCPRCGKTFAVKMFFNLLPPVFVRRCVHCGLPKYSDG